MGWPPDHYQHAASSPAIVTRLFYQHPRRARLSPGPTRFHEWINHRVLFGTDFAGAAQRESGRCYSRAPGIHQPKLDPARLVSSDLRDPFFSAPRLRRDHSRRDCRSFAGVVPVENRFRVRPRVYYRLASGLVGLSIPAMRTRPNRTGNLDRLLI